MISERWRDDPLEAVLAGETAESWEAKREAAQRARARGAECSRRPRAWRR